MGITGDNDREAILDMARKLNEIKGKGEEHVVQELLVSIPHAELSMISAMHGVRRTATERHHSVELVGVTYLRRGVTPHVLHAVH